MALPNSNISVPMVRAELGAATNDVGQLCIHPNVNKWSRWKPVRYGSVNPITEAQLRSTKCGLEQSVVGSALLTKNTYDALPDKLYQYSYNKPSGGLTSPYRLTDFNGYDKTAYKFYNLGGYKEQVFPYEGDYSFWLSITSYAGNISPNDFGWTGHYFGVLLVSRNNSSNYKIAYSPESFATYQQGTWYANVPISELTSGNRYDIYTFISDASKSNFYLLEGGYLGDTYIRTASVNTALSGYVYMNNQYDFSVTYTVSIYNYLSDPITITGLRLQVRYANTSGTLELGEQERTFGSITIPPGESYVNTSSFDSCLTMLGSRPGNPRLLLNGDYFGGTIQEVTHLNRPI